MANYTPSPAIVGCCTRAAKYCGPGVDLLLDYCELSVNGNNVRLRLPSSGASIEYNLRVITHRSRSGNLHIYKRGRMTKSIPVQVPNLLNHQAIDLENFIDFYRGQLMTYVNEYGSRYTGTVTDFRMTEMGPNRGYSAEFRFEVA